MASAVVKGRKGDVAMLAIWIGSIAIFFGYERHVDHRILSQLCNTAENLKAGQREAAQDSIRNNREFLRVHPGGTDDFTEAVIRRHIAGKIKIVNRYPPRKCPKP